MALKTFFQKQQGNFLNPSMQELFYAAYRHRDVSVQDAKQKALRYSKSAFKANVALLEYANVSMKAKMDTTGLRNLQKARRRLSRRTRINA